MKVGKIRGCIGNASCMQRCRKLSGTASCRVQVQGIDELYEEYKRQGILYDENTVAEEKPWGHREFPTLDHHCNLLTFYEEIWSSSIAFEK